MTDYTRMVVDYTENDNGAGARDALYNAINDKVMAHIEAKKQEVARNLVAQHDQSPNLSTSEDSAV